MLNARAHKTPVVVEVRNVEFDLPCHQIAGHPLTDSDELLAQVTRDALVMLAHEKFQ